MAYIVKKISWKTGLVIGVFVHGKHLSLVICVNPTRKHISLLTCVFAAGKHISVKICVPPAGKHISLVICVPPAGHKSFLGDLKAFYHHLQRQKETKKLALVSNFSEKYPNQSGIPTFLCSLIYCVISLRVSPVYAKYVSTAIHYMEFPQKISSQRNQDFRRPRP